MRVLLRRDKISAFTIGVEIARFNIKFIAYFSLSTTLKRLFYRLFLKICFQIKVFTIILCSTPFLIVFYSNITYSEGHNALALVSNSKTLLMLGPLPPDSKMTDAFLTTLQMFSYKEEI